MQRMPRVKCLLRSAVGSERDNKDLHCHVEEFRKVGKSEKDFLPVDEVQYLRVCST
jgi:hypothetical protein